MQNIKYYVIIILLIFKTRSISLVIYTVDSKTAGKPVLFVIKNILKISSKTLISIKKREDGILVNNNHVTVRYVLKENDILTINADDVCTNEKLIPVEMPLDIVYEDEDIILVNKDSNMPTHPSHGHFQDTLANGVSFHVKKSRGTPFVFRSINRLDRNTSGLVLIAKNKISAMRLQTQMKNGDIRKKYLALLCERPQEDEGCIETHIRRQTESIIFREVCEVCDDSSYALTEYSVIDFKNNVSLVCATPRTGRTHQLRVHFSHIGCPILGDELYGEPSEFIDRHALHAAYLSFKHPTTDKQMEFYTPPPKDMSECIAKFGLGCVNIEKYTRRSY